MLAHQPATADALQMARSQGWMSCEVGTKTGWCILSSLKPIHVHRCPQRTSKRWHRSHTCARQIQRRVFKSADAYKAASLFALLAWAEARYGASRLRPRPCTYALSLSPAAKHQLPPFCARLAGLTATPLWCLSLPANPQSSSRRTISKDEWSRKLAAVKLRKDDMNRLVMNFLVTEVRTVASLVESWDALASAPDSVASSPNTCIRMRSHLQLCWCCSAYVWRRLWRGVSGVR